MYKSIEALSIVTNNYCNQLAHIQDTSTIHPYALAKIIQPDTCADLIDTNLSIILHTIKPVE